MTRHVVGSVTRLDSVVRFDADGSHYLAEEKSYGALTGYSFNGVHLARADSLTREYFGPASTALGAQGAKYVRRVTGNAAWYTSAAGPFSGDIFAGCSFGPSTQKGPIWYAMTITCQGMPYSVDVTVGPSNRLVTVMATFPEAGQPPAYLEVTYTYGPQAITRPAGVAFPWSRLAGQIARDGVPTTRSLTSPTLRRAAARAAAGRQPCAAAASSLASEVNLRAYAARHRREGAGGRTQVCQWNALRTGAVIIVKVTRAQRVGQMPRVTAVLRWGAVTLRGR